MPLNSRLLESGSRIERGVGAFNTTGDVGRAAVGDLEANLDLLGTIDLSKVDKLNQILARSKKIVDSIKTASDVVRASQHIAASPGITLPQAYENVLKSDAQASALRDKLTAFQHGQRQRDRVEKYGSMGAWQVRQLELSDKINSILDPEGFREEMLRREWGSDADNILLAERQKKVDDARKQAADTLAKKNAERNFKWNYHNMSERERQLFDRTMYYGGGQMGRLMASSEIQEERRERLEKEGRKRHYARQRRRHEAKEAFKYDMMGEFEQRMFDLKGRYGGDASMADDSLRNSLKKELPFFFKNSKLSTKTLFNLSKSFGAIKHLPFGVGRMLTNPVALAAATYAGAVRFLSSSDAANKTMTGWANASNLYGTPSQKYQKAARLAGVEDPGTIAKTLGKFSLQYGGRENAESVLEEFGRQMQGMDETQKLYFADALGLSDTDVATAEFLAGGKKAEKFRKVAAAKSALDTVKTTGFASGSSFGDTMTSVGLAIPGMESALARTHTSESVAAAGNTVSIVLNGPVNVNAEDGEGFVESLVKESDSRSGSAVLSTVDSGEK